MTYSGFYTSKDLMERYQISPRTLNRWMNRKTNPFPAPTIPATGSLNRWAFEVVDAWEKGSDITH